MNQQTQIFFDLLNDWPKLLKCSEIQLYHYFEPEPGIFLAETPNVILRAYQAGYMPLSFLMEARADTDELRMIRNQVPDACCCTVSHEEMASIQGYPMTHGVICAMRRKTKQSAESLLDALHPSRIAVLENTMNPTNLGAIFRSAAALGVDAVLLSSGCTDPLYRRACRVSMGTVFQIPWTYCLRAPHAADTVKWLKAQGWRTAAMALRSDAVSVSDLRLYQAERLAIVLGTEGEGLHPETVAACDDVVMIPMAHGVDSLNVAAASAVAFWELRQRKNK